MGGYQTFGDMRTIMVRFNGPRRIGCIYVECIEMGADAFHRPEVLDYPCCGLEHATFGGEFVTCCPFVCHCNYDLNFSGRLVMSKDG